MVSPAEEPDNTPAGSVAAADEGSPAFVAAILASRTFEHAPTLRSLLAYLWLRRNEPISEYAVATEALGRGAMFNPKIDASVRVQVSRLRQRLAKYYEDEGKDAVQRLSIPLGCHLIELQACETGGAAVEAPIKLASATLGQQSRLIWVLCAVCAALLVSTAAFAFRLMRAETARANAPAARFWRAFFNNKRPTRLILPTPVFYSWSIPGKGSEDTMMIRDTGVNEFDPDISQQIIRDLAGRLGRPSLGQSYTVSSDTFAAVRLARFLDSSGLNTEVMSSASAPLEALDRENVVALGTWGTLAPLRPYLDSMSFELSRHEGSVTNKRPVAGEPPLVLEKRLSPERLVVPGVVAVLPGRANQTRLLVLAARHTSALVSFLTSSEGLEQLDRLWKERGAPEYYEVIINAEMNGDQLVRFWPALLHPYQQTTSSGVAVPGKHT